LSFKSSKETGTDFKGSRRLTCDLEERGRPEDLSALGRAHARILSGSAPVHVVDGEDSVPDAVVPRHRLIVRAHPVQEDLLSEFGIRNL